MLSSEASMVPTPSQVYFAPESYPIPHQYMQPQQHCMGPMRVPYPQGTLCGIQVQTQYNMFAPPPTMQYVHNSPVPMCVPLPESRFTPSTSLPSSLDSSQHISHVLQCYQQGGEDSEFVRKAIESLVKKVKDKREELEHLITAVTSGGKQHSGCVTIQRSLDGRLQVAGRKGVPHVVYARIWRWPNVNKNELVKLPICGIAVDHQDFICINPYHYERVVSNGIPPLDMKSLRIDPPENAKTEYPMTDYSDMAATSASDDNAIMNNYQDWNSSCQMNQVENFNGNQYMDHRVQQPDYMNDLNQVHIPTFQQPQLENWCSISYHELDSPVGETFKAPSLNMRSVVVDGGMDPHGDQSSRFCLGAIPNVHRGEASEKCRVHIGGGVHIHSRSNGSIEIEVMSLKPVFVRSGYLDYCNGVPYGTKVHRFVAENSKITVFDLRWAYREMKLRTQSATEAVRAQAAAVAGIPHVQVANLSDVMADSGVDGMRSAFCTLQLSFLKGWGGSYPRSSIKETPCWIEVQLHRPLQLLDQLLKASP